MKINWSHIGEGLGAIGDAKMNSDAADILNRKATYGQYTPDQVAQMQDQAEQVRAANALNDTPLPDEGQTPQGGYYDAKQGWIGADGQPAQGLQVSNTFAGQTRDQPFSDAEVRSKNLQDTIDFWRSKGTSGKEMAKELQDAATSELHNKLVTGQISQLDLERQAKEQGLAKGGYELAALKQAKDSQDKITDFMTRLYSTDPAVQKTALDEASAMHNGSDAIGGDSKSQVIQDPRTGANNLVYHPPTDQAGPPQVLSASDPNVLNTIRSEYIKNMLYQTKPEEMLKQDETAKQHAATIGVERDKLGLQRDEFNAKKPVYAAQADLYTQHGASYGATGANKQAVIDQKTSTEISKQALDLVTSTNDLGAKVVDHESYVPLNAIAHRALVNGQATNPTDAVLYAQQQMKVAAFSPAAADKKAQAELATLKQAGKAVPDDFVQKRSKQLLDYGNSLLKGNTPSAGVTQPTVVAGNGGAVTESPPAAGLQPRPVVAPVPPGVPRNRAGSPINKQSYNPRIPGYQRPES